MLGKALGTYLLVSNPYLLTFLGLGSPPTTREVKLGNDDQKRFLMCHLSSGDWDRPVFRSGYCVVFSWGFKSAKTCKDLLTEL